MNRLIKIILCVTAACVGIGSAALIIGLFLGGGRLYFMEDTNIAQAEHMVDGLVSRVRDQVQRQKRHRNNETAALDLPDEFEEKSGGNRFTYEEAYEDEFEEEGYYYGDQLLLKSVSSDIRNLEVDLRHGFLQIEESDDGRVWVSVSNETQDITAECINGSLMIHDNRQGSSGREDAYVFLQIPEDMQFGEINIQADAGSMTADCGFMADHLILSVDAGSIVIDEVQSDTLDASVGAGTMEIGEGMFGSAAMECGVGSITMDAEIIQDSRISCGMGSVYLELEDGVESMNYDLSCGMGCIQIGDHSYTALSKGQRIDYGAAANFTLSCGMGEICIE
ncbi:MAG: DUF4097 domain-containing protein [Eubacterium sp.]|nr:DUF4097 domain-containing protein [Eubacterium sp.]